MLKTMNLLEHYSRLQCFIEERLLADIYPEVPMQAHIQITHQMIARLNQVLPLRGKQVLDCGCGQGLALEEFTKLGAHPVGTTFGEDYQVCKKTDTKSMKWTNLFWILSLIALM